MTRITEWTLTLLVLCLAAGCGEAGDGGEPPADEPAAATGLTGDEEPAGTAPAATGLSGGEDAPSGGAEHEATATEIVPGLSMRVLEEGTGPVAEPGQTAVVHYTGWLEDPSAPDARGEKFDSSVDRGQPFEFPLGAGRVIRGWDEGVRGMQVGEVRELTIAPELGYGARGAPPAIPPDSTLVFEVELLDLKEDGGAQP